MVTSPTESASSEVSSAFTPVDDTPAARSAPARSSSRGGRGRLWDLQHFIDEAEQPRFGNCYMYWLKLRRTERLVREVPVTVCK